jgi:hypothetical protein
VHEARSIDAADDHATASGIIAALFESRHVTGRDGTVLTA